MIVHCLVHIWEQSIAETLVWSTEKLLECWNSFTGCFSRLITKYFPCQLRPIFLIWKVELSRQWKKRAVSHRIDKECVAFKSCSESEESYSRASVLMLVRCTNDENLLQSFVKSSKNCFLGFERSLDVFELHFMPFAVVSLHSPHASFAISWKNIIPNFLLWYIYFFLGYNFSSMVRKVNSAFTMNAFTCI